jgi:hypothetical protein
VQEELRAAMGDERRLWERVKGKHPGQSGHDPGAWQAWAVAERRVRELTQLADQPDERRAHKAATSWS